MAVRLSLLPACPGVNTNLKGRFGQRVSLPVRRRTAVSLRPTDAAVRRRALSGLSRREVWRPTRLTAASRARWASSCG